MLRPTRAFACYAPNRTSPHEEHPMNNPNLDSPLSSIGETTPLRVLEIAAYSDVLLSDDSRQALRRAAALITAQAAEIASLKLGLAERDGEVARLRNRFLATQQELEVIERTKSFNLQSLRELIVGNRAALKETPHATG